MIVTAVSSALLGLSPAAMTAGQATLRTDKGSPPENLTQTSTTLGPRTLATNLQTPDARLWREPRLAEMADSAESLGGEQTPVGLKADLPRRGQVRQPLADAEVAGVVDRGLGQDRPARTTRDRSLRTARPPTRTFTARRRAPTRPAPVASQYNSSGWGAKPREVLEIESK